MKNNLNYSLFGEYMKKKNNKKVFIEGRRNTKRGSTFLLKNRISQIVIMLLKGNILDFNQ